MPRTTLSRLSDHQLVRDLDRLVSAERSQLVEVLHRLNELDERKLYRDLGFRSLFCYCRERLKYSESAAGRRIAVARALRRAPEIDPMLASGDANLTTVAPVAGLLESGTNDTILERIRGRSRTEVEQIVAEYRPRRVIRDRVRTLCVAKPVAQEPALRLSIAHGEAVAHDLAATHGNATAREDARDPIPVGGGRTAAPRTTPCAPLVRRHEIRFTAGDDFMKKVDRARVLLSSRRPAATFEQVFGAAIDVFLDTNCPIRRARRRKEKARKRREKRTDQRRSSDQGERPRSGDVRGGVTTVCGFDKARMATYPLPPAGVTREHTEVSRHIPAAVRDAVHERDRGRCTYAGPDGRRCGAQKFLEIDHIEPFALGGRHNIANLRLLCSAHNRLAAERRFGRDIMDRYSRRE